MTAAAHDLTIEQGATFQFNLVWKDSNGSEIDLTGYSARMQIRPTYNSTTVWLSLTSATNGGIALGGVAGSIACTASATITAALPAKSGVYDLELQDGTGFVTRLVSGEVTITPEVTR